MPTPGEDGVRNVRRERDRDLCGLVAREARAIRVGVGADVRDRPAEEREVAGDGRDARARHLWVNGDREGGGRGAACHARAGIRVEDRSVPGGQVVDRVLAGLCRVPLDDDRVGDRRIEVGEQHPIRDRVALVVNGLAGAEVAVDPFNGVTAIGGWRGRGSVRALVQVRRRTRGQRRGDAERGNEEHRTQEGCLDDGHQRPVEGGLEVPSSGTPAPSAGSVRAAGFR